MPKTMPEDHPDSQLLELFLRGEAGRDERRGVVRHLLAGCAECLRVTRRLWSLGETGLEPAPADGAPKPPAASYGEAFSRIAERGPRRAAFALHGLALQLAAAGRGEEALQAIRRAGPIYEEYGDARNLVRLRHLEGKVEGALGSPRAAEAAFLEARQGFLREGLGAEAAGVVLDLALLYQREGRPAEVRRLAGELYPILRARGLRPGAAVALLLFRDLVETGWVTAEGLGAVSGYLNGGRSGCNASR